MREFRAEDTDTRDGAVQHAWDVLRRATHQSPWLLGRDPRTPTAPGRMEVTTMTHNRVARLLHHTGVALVTSKAAKLETNLARVAGRAGDVRHRTLKMPQRDSYLRRASNEIQRAVAIFGEIHTEDLELDTTQMLVPLPTKAALGVMLFTARMQVMERGRECTVNPVRRQTLTRTGFSSLQALEKNLAIVRKEGLGEVDGHSMWLAGFPMYMGLDGEAAFIRDTKVRVCGEGGKQREDRCR